MRGLRGYTDISTDIIQTKSILETVTPFLLTHGCGNVNLIVIFFSIDENFFICHIINIKLSKSNL